MVGRTVPATFEESRVMGIIAEYCGCLPCILHSYNLNVHATIQHVVEGYRLGQDMVYGACPWHHLGKPTPGKSESITEADLGPSLALNKPRYESLYGAERNLIKVQRFMIELYDNEPWEPHDVPPAVAVAVKGFWGTLQLENP